MCCVFWYSLCHIEVCGQIIGNAMEQYYLQNSIKCLGFYANWSNDGHLLGFYSVYFDLFEHAREMCCLHLQSDWIGSAGSTWTIYEFFYRPTNALWFYDAVFLYSDHKHVLATHVAIFGFVSARIHIYLYLKCVGITPQLKLYTSG
jgi:hypothetical protein